LDLSTITIVRFGKCQDSILKDGDAIMRTRYGFVAILFVLFIANSSYASNNPKQELKKYFNDAAIKVKQTDNPVQKRLILNKTFGRVITALDILYDYPFLSHQEKKEVTIFRKTIKSKYDELNGLNGYTRIADSDINNFADYSVQSIEQANTVVITISLTTLLLIIIIILLLRP
jgi:hypothetical protein